jgi:polysaccharide biosynthesis transport protein
MDNPSFDITLTRSVSEVGAAAYQDRRAREVWRAVWYRRRLIVALTILAIACAVVGLALRPPSYSAQAILQLDVSQHDLGGAAGQQQPSGVTAEASSVVQSVARVVQSPLVARQVAERLGLDKQLKPTWITVEFNSMLDRIGRAVHALFGYGEARPVPADPLDRAARWLLSNLTVETDSQSYLVTIGFSSNLPAVSAKIANAVAGEYISLQAQNVADRMEHVADRIGSAISAKADQLRGVDAEILDYRTRIGALELGAAGGLTEKQLKNLSTQLQYLQSTPLLQAQIQWEAAARQLAEFKSRLGAVNPVINAAQSRLVQATTRLSQEVERAVSTAGGSASGAEAGLKHQLQTLDRSFVQDKEGDIVRLRDAEARADTIRNEIQFLTRSYDQAAAARAIQSVPVSLIAPAQPNTLPAAHTTLILGLAALGGLIGGIALAMFLESGDQGFRTSSDVWDEGYTRCLGMVPELPGGIAMLKSLPPKRRTEVVAFNEAVRMVAVATGLLDGGGDCQVVLVTSSVSGEGRSTLCRSLARALLLAGKQVMIVDAVPQRQTHPALAEDQSQLADTKPVSGQLKAASQPRPLAVKEAGYVMLESKSIPGVAGTDVFDPAGLIHVIGESRRHFDVIIVEGPPVLLVGDSLLLGKFADKVLLAARWKSTRRHDVRAALHRLQENNAVVNGIVITRVDLAQHAKLGFVDQCSYYKEEQTYYEGLYGKQSRTSPLL